MGVTGPIMEVGALFGGYTAQLLAHHKGIVHAVDPWKNQDTSVYQDGANLMDMEDVYRKAKAAIGNHPRCLMRRMMSAEAVKDYADESLAAVYLDGNHALPAIREDISIWFPKVKVGGIFGGHDFNIRYDRDTNSDAQTAVMEFAEKVGQWPQVTWCTSWWFVKTAEMASRWNTDRGLPWSALQKAPAAPIVVLAVARPDYHLAVKWLKWAAMLSRMEGASKYGLVVWYTQALSLKQVQDMTDIGNDFHGVQIQFQHTPELYERGYAPSANYMFRTAMEFCEKAFPLHAPIWCEADTVPMCADWVDRVWEEYQKCGKPFLGDFVDHRTPHGNIPHMTGVAVYPPGWRRKAPSIAFLPDPAPEQGWDSKCSCETVPQMARSKTIRQVWRPKRFTPENWRQIVPEGCALFHQCKDGSLIDVLCHEYKLPAIPLIEPIAESTYPKTVYIAPEPGKKIAPPRTEILIVTFARDIPFLKFCLRSLEKNAAGFAGITVVVPRHEKGQYDWVRRGVRVEYFDEVAGKGMLHHEVQICRADEWCPNAEFICHIDADVMAFRRWTPDDLFVDGRAKMVREHFDLIKNPNRHIWRKTVKAALGFEPEYETMVCKPQVYPRQLYAQTRFLVEEHTGKKFDEYVLSCQNEFPQGFAEFVTLGAVGIRDMAGCFEFVDYDHAAEARAVGQSPESFQYAYRRDRDFLTEFWSHGGIARYKSDCEAIMAGRMPAWWIK